MMTHRLLAALALFAASGCLAQTETAPAPAECAWVDDSYACDPELFTREVSQVDAGDTFCWIYTYHCGDVVDACKREVYSCQPTTVLGGPDPSAPRE